MGVHIFLFPNYRRNSQFVPILRGVLPAREIKVRGKCDKVWPDLRSITSSSPSKPCPTIPQRKGVCLISGERSSDTPLPDYCYSHLPNHHYSTNSLSTFCCLMHFIFLLEMSSYVSLYNLAKDTFTLKLLKDLISMLISSS